MYKERFLALVNSIGSSDDDWLSELERAMNSFIDYVSRVYTMEYMIPILRFRYEGEDYRNKVEDLDRRRRVAHEAAIGAVTKTTRWAKLFDVTPLYDGDTDDRYAIADFCMAIVNEFFEEGEKPEKQNIKELINRAERVS